MANLRAGVIGIGSMGRHHVRVLRELDGVDLVAVADAGGDRFGVAAPLAVLDTVEDFAAAGLDLAVVAVPTAHHEPVAVRLAAAGVAALVEKPVADSAAAAQRLQDVFAAAGVLGCVGHVERFNPAIAELRRRVQRGDLGEVYQITTRRQSPFPGRIADVGVVKDLASHDINTAAWIAGSDYAEVAAQVAHRTGRPHEDMVSVTGRFASGVLVNHLVNWLTPFKERITAVTGERGTMIADSLNVTLTFWANGSVPTEWEPLRQFRGVSEGDVIRYALATREPLRAEDEAFRDAVLGQRDDAVPLADGVATLRVAEAVLQAARDHAVIALPAA
ncbi:MAG: Gfo/Idh/MocA family oxidoreductase [Propionibacteriaceae bacterium]|jgi:predicted dehydrogenase|nr:Gfo/Idh/MocA family oxidoreductase [Propionibacteriaceae bacterium]